MSNKPGVRVSTRAASGLCRAQAAKVCRQAAAPGPRSAMLCRRYSKRGTTCICRSPATGSSVATSSAVCCSSSGPASPPLAPTPGPGLFPCSHGKASHVAPAWARAKEAVHAHGQPSMGQLSAISHVMASSGPGHTRQATAAAAAAATPGCGLSRASRKCDATPRSHTRYFHTSLHVTHGLLGLTVEPGEGLPVRLVGVDV
ncbi:hypothetical protein V8C86DRAFT_2448741 [Haematococcus lacustris]